MSQGGTLTIESDLDSQKRFVQISFSDTGCGISEENLSKIFDPFFTTKRSGKGTGLGLSVSYGIIQRHKGFLEVKSKLGEGSTFRIKLPLE
jgi:signal transduction histidine kinase